VAPPNVNTGEAEFRARDGRIYYGLGAVKNVGLSAVEKLVEERAPAVPSARWRTCAAAQHAAHEPARVRESSSARVPSTRSRDTARRKLAALDMVLERAARRARDVERGQFGLFGGEAEPEDAPLPDVEAWASQDQLQKEKEALGLFLSGHPLDRFRDLIVMIRTTSSKELQDMPAGERAVLGGLVTRSSSRWTGTSARWRSSPLKIRKARRKW
jgi:DNA polymerase-3 subunit alpha